MLAVNPLVGFWAGSPAGSAPTPPSNPLNAWQHDSLADIHTDNAGSDDLSFWYGLPALVSGKDGDGIEWDASSIYAIQSGLVTGDFSAVGWLKPGGDFSGSNIVPWSLRSGAYDISLEMSDASTDGECEVSVTWDDGTNSGSLDFTGLNDSDWFFFAIVADMGVGLTVRINSTTQSDTSTPPNITGAMDLRLNTDSDFSGGGSVVADEFLMWHGSLRTAAELDYLYNGGAGRFYPW